MKKTILSLEGVQMLTKEQQKNALGGTFSIGSDSYKVTCNNGTIYYTNDCANKNLVCQNDGGASSCVSSKSPLDPPGIGFGF